MYNMIYCKKNNIGGLTFMIKYKGVDYYLFDQKYKSATQEFFSRGVELNRAFKKSLAKDNKDLLKTMEKIYTFIKYAEKENCICILNKTIERQAA